MVVGVAVERVSIRRSFSVVMLAAIDFARTSAADAANVGVVVLRRFVATVAVAVTMVMAVAGSM